MLLLWLNPKGRGEKFWWKTVVDFSLMSLSNFFVEWVSTYPFFVVRSWGCCFGWIPIHEGSTSRPNFSVTHIGPNIWINSCEFGYECWLRLVPLIQNQLILILVSNSLRLKRENLTAKFHIGDLAVARFICLVVSLRCRGGMKMCSAIV